METWVEVTEVRGPLVSFRTSFSFRSDGALLTSESTIRFRDRDEIERSLARGGFDLLEVRDAPDRPGREHVYLARAAAPAGSPEPGTEEPGAQDPGTQEEP